MRYQMKAYVFLGFLAISSVSLSQIEETSDNFQAGIDAYQQYIHASKHALNGLEVQAVSFSVQKSDNSLETFERKGFLALRPDALGTVIICHGYTQSKHEAFFLKILFSHFNVLAFDFRAHGELIEKGQFSTIGRDEVFDVVGAVNFVKSLPCSVGKPIIGFGFSMGAVSLLQAQAKHQDLFDLLILDSPFDSSSTCMERNIDRMLTFTLFGKERKFPGKAVIMKMLYSEKMSPVVKKFFRWASGMNPYIVPTKFVPVIPIENAANISVPCFFISCERDRSVQVDSVMRLYDAVQSPFKRLWITQGLKHCGSCLAQPELYAYKINKFINAVLKKDFRVSEKIRDDRVEIQSAQGC